MIYHDLSNRIKQFENVAFMISKLIRDHPYFTSAYGLGRLVQKKANFADVQYCIYADIVNGWVQKSTNMCWHNIWTVPNQPDPLILILILTQTATSLLLSIYKRLNKFLQPFVLLLPWVFKPHKLSTKSPKPKENNSESKNFFTFDCI